MRRATRMHAWHADPVVDDVPKPVAGEGESFVAIAAAAVAHIDLTVASGTFAMRPPLPYVPGTEGAGRIVRSGRFAPGTPVRVRGAGRLAAGELTLPLTLLALEDAAEALARVREGTASGRVALTMGGG